MFIAMSKSNRIVNICIWVALALVFLTIIWPNTQRKPPVPGSYCKNNLKQIGLALMINDHKE